MSDVQGPRINYAKFARVDSLLAAIVLAVLYAPLAVLFVIKSFSRPTYVHYVMTLFCISSYPYASNPFILLNNSTKSDSRPLLYVRSLRVQIPQDNSWVFSLQMRSFSASDMLGCSTRPIPSS